jgi:hypothetical protein
MALLQDAGDRAHNHDRCASKSVVAHQWSEGSLQLCLAMSWKTCRPSGPSRSCTPVVYTQDPCLMHVHLLYTHIHTQDVIYTESVSTRWASGSYVLRLRCRVGISGSH